MLRRTLAGVIALALVCSFSLYAAQVKEMPKNSPRSAAPKAAIVDINSAPETEIVALGVDRAVAKKIIDARPFRNKRELVTRKLLTPEQYDKLKDQFVAKQPKKGA
jgi:DNA uptake protein ComE-like DNA-binding protein